MYPDPKVARHKGDKLEFGLVPGSPPIFFYWFARERLLFLAEGTRTEC